jgi:hypothetical protein
VSRSLQASPSGIELAKRALVRKSLTQKAIANELTIASWSTINKFFNGKPIDRFIFIEICETLDLDWERVVQNAERETVNAEENLDSSFLAAVQQNAIAAREALTPRILERIPRKIVQEKYLVAIARGLEGEQSRLIPIVAPAGYGKSTILGDIYDQLTQSNKTWVGLILCSSVSVTPTYFSFLSSTYLAATYAPPSSALPPPSSPSSPGIYQTSAIDAAFGKSLCGSSQSIVEVVTQLVTDHGKGVLLIDTLDLIINREFVPVFNLLLRQLLDAGLTIVLTCRDHEYNDYLEPTRERLSGISQRIDRHTVPNFTTAEIRAAAEVFFRKLEPNAPDRGKPFADKILSLSADNRSLKDIIQNPLLLALLCDLFAQDGNVPPDLTVSKLYRRYWEEKVAYSRVDQSHAALLAIEKESLCLTIARRLFERSPDKLCESLYQDEFGVEFTEIIVDAYSELLSEGVLDLLPSRKIHFFHQTLLEYAIAYWLTRHTAQAQRQQLLEWMRQPNASHTRTHWLPILRQHLTIIDEPEFEALITQLNHQDVGIFGIIAYAAASRDRPDALRQLLPIALELGESYQRRLRQALSSAPRSLVEDTWDILLQVLQQSNHATAGNTAQLAGSLLAEWWQALSDRLPDTLNAIAQRLSTHLDEPAMFSGWLLQPCLPLIEQSADPRSLTALRQYFPMLGYRTCATVIQLHELPSVSDAAKLELLHQLLSQPVSKHDEVREALSQFLASLLPRLLEHSNFPLGRSWTQILHHVLPDRWDVVQAKAIGQWAARDDDVFTALLYDYGWGESRQIQRSLMAINESLKHDGNAKLSLALTQIDLAPLSSETCHRFSSLINRKNMMALSADEQEAIARWLHPYAPERIQDLYLALDVLADASLTARETLLEFVDDLPTPIQSDIQIRLLRFQPIDQHPPILQLDKPSQRLLIQVYRQQAETNLDAFKRLLEIAQGQHKDIALAASKDLDQICSWLQPDQVLELLRSPFPGVRVHVLTALINLSRQSKAIASHHLTLICRSLLEADDQAVARLLCNLITVWVRQHQQLPPDVFAALLLIPIRLLERNLFEGGIARALMDALKAIAQSEAPEIDPVALSGLVQQLLVSINLIQVRNSESEMIDLLCAVNRLHPPFLANLVEQSCPTLVQKGWNRNINAVVKTLSTVEGRRSPLLDQILASAWCTAAVRNMILEVRGV